MGLPKKIIIIVMAVLTMVVCSPKVFYASEGNTDADDSVTVHKIEIRSTPDEDIVAETRSGKSKWWLWALIGVVVIGGAAALAAGSSSDSGGGSSTASSGSAEISW